MNTKFRRCFRALSCAASIVLTLSQPALADVTFTAIDVPGSSSTIPRGINDAGEIVGYYVDATGDHGFLYSASGLTRFDAPGASSTFAIGINSARQIVGQYNQAPIARGFRDDAGVFVTIGTGFQNTLISGIDSNGELVGGVDNGDYVRGFFRSGTTDTIFMVPGSVYCGAQGVSAGGEMIVGAFDNGSGRHGFLHNGPDFSLGFTQLDVPGSNYTEAAGINDWGDIIGSYRIGGYHGFLYQAGTFTTIDVPDAIDTHITGINNSEVLVGFYSDALGRIHGFLTAP